MNMLNTILIAVLLVEFNVVLYFVYRTIKSYKRKFYPDIKKVEDWIEALPKAPK